MDIISTSHVDISIFLQTLSVYMRIYFCAYISNLKLEEIF